MKPRHYLLIPVLLLLAPLQPGCGPSAKVDSQPLQAAFASADSDAKGDVNKAVGLLNAREYPKAVLALRDAVKRGKTTPDQDQAIINVLTQIQKVAATVPAYDTPAQDEATEQLMAALEKREPRPTGAGDKR